MLVTFEDIAIGLLVELLPLKVSESEAFKVELIASLYKYFYMYIHLTDFTSIAMIIVPVPS